MSAYDSLLLHFSLLDFVLLRHFLQNQSRVRPVGGLGVVVNVVSDDQGMSNETGNME